MKQKRYFLLLGGLLLSAGMMLWTSCTDDWNEHYNQEASDLSAYPTLLTRLKDTRDPDVRDGRFTQFLRVLEATGYDQHLSNPALYTLFAPMDMTAEEADELIDRFNQEKSTKQDAYNTVVTQFVQNHISLYGHNFVKQASSETNDTVCMLNGKYMRVHNDVGSNDWVVGPNVQSLKGSNHGVITEKLLCNNGYLYKIKIEGGKLPCYLNVKEATDTISVISKYLAYKSKYDEFTLDESKSVPGDIVDGNQVWIDSVINYENAELSAQYGAYFHREDSSYLFLVPSDKLWNTLYEKYSEYFNYKADGDDEEAREEAAALKDTWTSRAIMYGRVFNLNSANNKHMSDSLCSTNYSKYQTRPKGPYHARYNGKNIDADVDYRTYVFREPLEADGILNGVDEKLQYECSNGLIYVDDRDKDVLAKSKDKFWKTWFTSSSYSSQVGISPKSFEVVNGEVRSGKDRFNYSTHSVKSEVPWIVCRKKKCGKEGEGFKKNKIYNVRVSVSGDSTVYYLDTIGTKVYHVEGNTYMDVVAEASKDKVREEIAPAEVKEGEKKYKDVEKQTRVYFDYPLGTNILSNVYYNAYVVTVPSDVRNGATTRAQGLAFKVIENYYEDEVGANGKYVPYNKDAEESYYPDYNDFDEIYAGLGSEEASTTLKCKLPRDGFVMTDLVVTQYEDPLNLKGFKYHQARSTGNFLYFFPYEEDSNDEYGQAPDKAYVPSTNLKNKVYVPKTQDVDVIQVMKAKKTDYATVNQNNAFSPWVLRVYNALQECHTNMMMELYDDDHVDPNYRINSINSQLFNTNNSDTGMRIARIIVKPFNDPDEAKNYTIADLMEEYHIATTFQRTEE